MNNIESCLPTDWNIVDQVSVWSAHRNQWQKEFQKNYSATAAKIAESITKEVFESLKVRLQDVFKAIPTPSNPLQSTFRLDMDHAASLKKWMKETAELPPFNEWFKKFEKNDDEIQSNCSFGKVRREKASVDAETGDYLEAQFAIIGHEVERIVKDNLSLFARISRNETLGFKVEWYRKAEKYLSNPSSFQDNYIQVQLWIKQAGDLMQRGTAVESNNDEETHKTSIQAHDLKDRSWNCIVS